MIYRVSHVHENDDGYLVGLNSMVGEQLAVSGKYVLKYGTTFVRCDFGESARVMKYVMHLYDKNDLHRHVSYVG